MDTRYKNFKNLLYVTWDHLGLPEPTPVQYDIADYLQHGPKRSIIEAFRGVGKSYVASALVVHQLLLNPDLKILVVSASKVRSDDFTTFTMRLIQEMPVLQHLMPRGDQRNSKISFDVGPAIAAHSPSVKSVGITGQLAGSRADLIIADDIEVPNNSMTQPMRDKLSEAVKEFDAILKPGGRIVYLGTPQTEMSLYNALPDRGYKMRIWPARVPSRAKIDKSYAGRLAPFIENLLESGQEVETSTDPKRFSDFDLMERELSYGRSGFALQYMLDTALSDANRYPLKVADLIIADLGLKQAREQYVWSSDPRNADNFLDNVAFRGDKFYRPESTIGDLVDYQGTVMAIDPSGRGKDELSYCIISIINSQLFLRKLEGLQGGYSKANLDHLAKMAKSYSVKDIVVESNFGDGMFNALFQPVLRDIYPCSMEEVRHSTQKELRMIDTLEPILNQHRLIVDSGVIQQDFESVKRYPVEKQMQYMLIYQLTRVTKERGALKQDDRLDVLAIGVHYWVEKMAANVQQQMNDRKIEMLEDELVKTHKALESGLAQAMGHVGAGSYNGESIL